MPARNGFRIGTILFLVAVAALLGDAVHCTQQFHGPSAANASLFLKSYSPKSVVEPFKLDASSSEAGGNGDSAGTQCSNHSREYEYDFVMRRGQGAALMHAVAADITRSLQTTGARIPFQSGDADSGFLFRYVASPNKAAAPAAGQDVGMVTVQEGNSKVTRATPLTDDRQDEELKVAIYETWFARGDHSSALAERGGLCR